MNWRSMRARATIGFVAAFALLLLVTGAGLLSFAHFAEQERIQTLLATTADELDAELSDSTLSPRQRQEIVNADSAAPYAHELVAFVYDEKGRLIAHSGKRVPLLNDNSQWMTHSVRHGKGRIVVAFPWDSTARFLGRLARLLLAGALVVLAASAVGAWALVGRVLSPIDRLAEAARTAPVENAHLQAPSEDAEVQRLVSTLNDFLTRLRESNRAKDRFYAAASHELRTPLQGLAGFLEIGLARPRERDELVSILREAQDQSQRLVKLTQDLLSLNQLENSSIGASMEQAEIDVADVVERALGPLEAVRRARDLKLELDLPSGAEAEISAPWSHVEMLVRNLIENAHKYAPDGGQIRVTWEEQTLRVWNTVAWNTKDAHKSEKLNRLFEPFYRLDASREGQVTGNGLGLAICHAIAQSNGWQITLQATSDAEPGLEARIEFVTIQIAATAPNRAEVRGESGQPLLMEGPAC
jgi:signal transduction histidine kinase